MRQKVKLAIHCIACILLHLKLLSAIILSIRVRFTGVGIIFFLNSVLMLSSIVAVILTARVAQWIRRRSPKPKIGGSSPPMGTLLVLPSLL